MRLLLAALLSAALSIPAYADCVPRQFISSDIAMRNPGAKTVVVRDARIDRLVAAFNATPPVTKRIGRADVDKADIWSKPLSIDVMVVFYKGKCFVAFLRMGRGRLKRLLGTRT